MPPAHRGESVEERLATLEERIDGIARDIELQRAAWTRRSEEFHDLERAVTTMATTQQNAREAEAHQYRRMEVRIQVLTIVIGLAAIVAPVVTAIVVSQ